MSGSQHDSLIAVVGATGAVGRELLNILHDRGVAASRVRALASARSAGASAVYGGGSLRVDPLDDASLHGAALAIFAADAAVARTFGPPAVARGVTVIDNSSAFRMDPAVPLVVPEVNSAAMTAKRGSAQLIANPNCCAAILVTALEPIRKRFGVRSLTVTTYQSVSGAGIAAMDELAAQAREVLAGKPAQPSYFREPCAFNVFSHDSAVDSASGLNVEEQKIIEETRKIWGLPHLTITPMCVRVPVMRAHTLVIALRLESPARYEDLRVAIGDGEGVQLVDDRATNSFPTPLKAAGRDPVLVGRLKPDPAFPLDADGASDAWCVMACGDQLRKGAALNAVQIAQRLGLVPA